MLGCTHLWHSRIRWHGCAAELNNGMDAALLATPKMRCQLPMASARQVEFPDFAMHPKLRSGNGMLAVQRMSLVECKSLHRSADEAERCGDYRLCIAHGLLCCLALNINGGLPSAP